MDLDEILARHAEKAGARLMERTAVTGPVLDERTGRVVGVTARPVDDRGRKIGDDETYTAPRRDRLRRRLAPGWPSRWASSAARTGRWASRVRAYYETPRHDDEWMESWLELWDGEPDRVATCCPATAGSSGSATAPPTSASASSTPRRPSSTSTTRTCCTAGSAHTPEEWGFRDENLVGRIGSAALPMGFNRKPHYTRGVLLVGDSGGMVNPFNGEGIDYALESGHMAAETVVQALARPEGPARERVLQGYAAALDAAYGGYFTLGRVFAKMIGNPTFMKQATKYGLPRTALMRFTLKLMANLTDPRDGDVSDRVINALAKVAPAA